MGLLTAERRAFLRRLKTEFDELFASVDPSMDRSDLEYADAERAYKEWRKAIDMDALILLDDLDAAEEKISRISGELGKCKPAEVTMPASGLPDADATELFEAIRSMKEVPVLMNFDPVRSAVVGEEPFPDSQDWLIGYGAPPSE